MAFRKQRKILIVKFNLKLQTVVKNVWLQRPVGIAVHKRVVVVQRPIGIASIRGLGGFDRALGWKPGVKGGPGSEGARRAKSIRDMR